MFGFARLKGVKQDLTDKPTDVAAYAFRSISSQLVAMMDAEGIDKVVGIGHDFGERQSFSVLA